jgi:glycolate oxidase FAD binding subunit
MPEAYQPDDETALLEAVNDSLQAGATLDLQGNGSRSGLGRPVSTDRRLSLDRLSGIRFYEAEELVLCAGAGTPLTEIFAALAEKRQMLAFEPPDWGPAFGASEGAGTLGGLVACNLSGPRRFKAGALRDHLLGFRAVSGRGELFKSGGRVMKNVTGYDLSKLIAGSYGTLAALSEVTVKVLPQPESSASLVTAGLADEVALEAMTLALQSSCEVSGAAHLSAKGNQSWLPAELGGGEGSLTCLRLEGPAPSVAFRLDRLKDLLPAAAEQITLEKESSETLWRGIRDLHCFAQDGESLIWRLSLAPVQSAGYLARLKQNLDFAYAMDWGGGLIWLSLDAASAGNDGGTGLVRRGLAELGGHATLVRAPVTLRRSLSVFQPLSSGAELLTRRIKEAFDPKGILNPGRLYDGL